MSLNTDSTIRVNLTIPIDLLRQVDDAAAKDYTSRSDIIRQALLYYLRPGGCAMEAIDAEELIKILNHRKAKASLNKIRRELDSYH